MEAVTLGWELVQELTTNAHDFWLALKGFICMAFHHELLQLTESQAPTLVATLKQVIKIRLVDLKRREIFFNFQHALSIMCVWWCCVIVFRLPLSCWSCLSRRAECLVCCFSTAVTRGCQQTEVAGTRLTPCLPVFSATSASSPRPASTDQCSGEISGNSRQHSSDLCGRFSRLS